MKRRVEGIVVGCALLAMSPAAFAQARPDLSGRWQLNVAGSAYEQSPGPRAEIETITQLPTQVRLQVVSTTRDITERYDLTITTDGTAVAIAGDVHVDPARILRSVSAQWDGPVLVLREQLETDEGPFEAVSRYALSSDSRTLSVQTSTADGHVIRTLMFDRCAEIEACK